MTSIRFLFLHRGRRDLESLDKPFCSQRTRHFFVSECILTTFLLLTKVYTFLKDPLLRQVKRERTLLSSPRLPKCSLGHTYQSFILRARTNSWVYICNVSGLHQDCNEPLRPPLRSLPVDLHELPILLKPSEFLLTILPLSSNRSVYLIVHTSAITALSEIQEPEEVVTFPPGTTTSHSYRFVCRRPPLRPLTGFRSHECRNDPPLF